MFCDNDSEKYVIAVLARNLWKFKIVNFTGHPKINRCKFFITGVWYFLGSPPVLPFWFFQAVNLFCRPVIDPIASIFDRMLCGRFEASNDGRGYTVGSAPLPGSDTIEATRRR